MRRLITGRLRGNRREKLAADVAEKLERDDRPRRGHLHIAADLAERRGHNLVEQRGRSTSWCKLEHGRASEDLSRLAMDFDPDFRPVGSEERQPRVEATILGDLREEQRRG